MILNVKIIINLDKILFILFINPGLCLAGTRKGVYLIPLDSEESQLRLETNENENQAICSPPAITDKKLTKLIFFFNKKIFLYNFFKEEISDEFSLPNSETEINSVLNWNNDILIIGFKKFYKMEMKEKYKITEIDILGKNFLKVNFLFKKI